MSRARRRFVVSALAATAGVPLIATRAFAAGSGVSDREVVLGQSAVLSGPLGTSVQGFVSGANLAFDAENQRGGVLGRRIRLVSLDDELKPEKTTANYRTLLTEHRAFAFFGAVGTATTAAAAPILRETNAPLIGNYAVGDAVREGARGAAYFVRATYGRESERLVELLSTIGTTRIAVAHLDNPGGVEVLRMVRDALKRRQPGTDVVASAAVKNDGSNAVDAARALAANDPQAVIIFHSGPPVAELMKTMWDQRSNPLFYGLSSVAGDKVARSLGALMQGLSRGLSVAQVVPYPWSEASTGTQAFKAQCQAKQLEPGYYNYEGWINAQLVIEALRRAGPELNRAALHAAMRTMKLRVGGLDLDFTAGNATGSKLVELVHARADGSYLR